MALMFCGAAAMAVTAAQGRSGRASAKNNPDEKEWIQMFNGRDLADWTPKFAHHDLGENFNDTFRVEDGLLKVRYDKWLFREVRAQRFVGLYAVPRAAVRAAQSSHDAPQSGKSS